MDWMVERNGFELPVPLGFLTESRVLWQFRFLRERRSALTEKEERMGSGLLSLEQADRQFESIPLHQRVTANRYPVVAS